MKWKKILYKYYNISIYNNFCLKIDTKWSENFKTKFENQKLHSSFFHLRPRFSVFTLICLICPNIIKKILVTEFKQ